MQKSFEHHITMCVFCFQSIPRTVLLSKNGKQLVQWPVKEIEKLRSKNVSFHDKKLKSGSVLEVPGITASQVIMKLSLNNGYA
jgi:beta-fructofuranosidase